MNKRCKLCQNYIKNEHGKFECSRFLMGILSCHFIPKEIEELKKNYENVKNENYNCATIAPNAPSTVVY